jgi:hypothetical protein
MTNIFTIPEAAQFANVTTSTLYRHVRMGNIRANKVPNNNISPINPHPFVWLVDQKDIETYYYQVAPGKKQHTRKQTKPQKTMIRWINIYPKDVDNYLFKSKKEALENADSDVVETKPIQIAL